MLCEFQMRNKSNTHYVITCWKIIQSFVASIQKYFPFLTSLGITCSSALHGHSWPCLPTCVSSCRRTPSDSSHWPGSEETPCLQTLWPSELPIFCLLSPLPGNTSSACLAHLNCNYIFFSITLDITASKCIVLSPGWVFEWYYDPSDPWASIVTALSTLTASQKEPWVAHSRGHFCSYILFPASRIFP